MSGLDDSIVRPKSAYFVRKTPETASNPAAKTVPTLNIPGTRTSIQNNQLLTPIGIPSIDFYIGGGLPVGGVCLIGQDRNGSYTDLIKRCFIAEGVSYKHAIYVADPNEEVDKLFQRIPAVNKIDESDTPKSDEKLRIAWRYSQQSQPTSDSGPKTLQPNYFRTDKLMSRDEINAQSNLASFKFEESVEGRDGIYSKLAQKLTSHIDNLELNVLKTKSYTNILRVVLNSMGGLFYNDQSTLDDDYSTDFCKFLLYLRQLMRHSLAVCLVTVPNEIVSNPELFEKLSHLVDYAFIMDDSVNTVSRITNTEYNGLFRLVKLPRLNSLNACFTPPTLDLAFFYRKKRLVVEQMHLPPELGENDESQKGRTNTSVTMSCSSSVKPSSILEKTGHNPQLDF